jgi:hypothetical protein
MRTPPPHRSLVIENICNSFALHMSVHQKLALSLDFYSDHNKITKLKKDWNYPYSTLRVCLHCGRFSNLISIPKKDDPLKIVSTYIPCTISAKKVLEPPFDSGSSKRRNTTCLLLTKIPTNCYYSSWTTAPASSVLWLKQIVAHPKEEILHVSS